MNSRTEGIFDAEQTRRAFEHGFGAFRDNLSRALEPCKSCEYLPLCKGGCRVVAHADGNWWRPDPGCPRVTEYRASHRDRT